ncbi:MAG: retropepsin-like aspartic protease family protein [Burkholderiales bacterium]
MKRTDCIAALGLALALLGPAAAADLNVVGLFGNKAVVSINGSPPRTMSVGQRSPEGVALVAVDRETATFEVDGERRTLRMGQAYTSRAAAGSGSVTLKADARGHFLADGQVNGGSVRFLVDTGATTIALPAADARRLGIDYAKGQRGIVQTAGGPTPAYRVILDTVRIGDIAINGVEAVVIETGLPFALLGMSFLNRTEMRREGETMVLIKRF